MNRRNADKLVLMEKENNF